MTDHLTKPMRAALASGRVRTLLTAKVLLARGWIEALPERTSMGHLRATSEAWTALRWTSEGEAARARIRPLPPTPESAVALLRGSR